MIVAAADERLGQVVRIATKDAGKSRPRSGFVETQFCAALRVDQQSSMSDTGKQ